LRRVMVMMAAFMVMAVLVIMVMVVVLVVICMRVRIMLICMLMLMLRLRFHLFVIRSEVGLRLGNMLEQFGQHGADVVIGGEIENLLAFTLGAHDPRRPQQTQVMADERRRQPERFRDRPHRAAPVDTRQHDAQPRGIAQQAEQVGERNDALIGCDKRRRQDRSANI
jgi:hypothetical protein